MKKICLSNEEIANFFFEFSILREAQFYEKEALQLIMEGESKKNVTQFLNSLINAPSFLSGLAQFENFIPQYIIALLEKTIQTDSEVKALEDIYTHLKNTSVNHNKITHKQNLKSFLLYPIIILLFALMVGITMMTFVLPVYEEVFKSFGNELPYLTKLVGSFFYRLQEFWWIMIGIAIIVINSCKFIYLHFSKLRQFIFFVLLKTPFINTLIKTAESVIIIKTFILLCNYQFSLSESLRLSATATKNIYYIIALTESANKVKKGIGLADSLAKTQIFPKNIIVLLSAFEKAQQLNILRKIEQFYYQQNFKQSTSLSYFINIFILIICCVIVGIMIIGFYLPFFTISSLG